MQRRGFPARFTQDFFVAPSWQGRRRNLLATFGGTGNLASDAQGLQHAQHAITCNNAATGVLTACKQQLLQIVKV